MDERLKFIDEARLNRKFCPVSLLWDQNIVELERLALRFGPRGANGDTTPAAIRDRQFERIKESLHLVTGFVYSSRAHDRQHLRRFVQGSEPLAEAFSIDQPFS